MHRNCLAFAVLVSFGLVYGARAAEPKSDDSSPVATLESNQKSGDGQIRQFALDGNDDTYFASEKNAANADHLTVVFEQPLAIKSISISSGKTSGENKLTAAAIAISDDGKSFEEIAKFTDGAARAEINDRKVKAVRVQVAEAHEHPLVIREITIDAEPKVAAFKYPIEVVVDVADAPEMQEWADNVARICERAYPMINTELASDGFKAPHLVTMRLSKDYRGVAAASGTRIIGSVKFFKDHPDDVGAMVHEMCHVVQRYRRRGNPGWLVEGVADYVRFFKFEPGKIGPINVARARYDRSYRVTAAFLAYTAEKYDKDLVRKLNQIMREGNYKEEIFKDLTGRTVQELDEEWRLSLGAKIEKPTLKRD
jgi:hypothetical protein